MSALQEAAVWAMDFAGMVWRRLDHERPIVVLGRDAWLIVPILRDRGMKAQYFLWSRNQGTGWTESCSVQPWTMGVETSTAAQWMKEVPPHAQVVDTGMRGSILDAIRAVDATVAMANCILLKSNGKYPQLAAMGRSEKDQLLAVAALENAPKLVGACQGYENDLAKFSSAWGSEISTVSWNFRVLRQCSLPLSAVKRYCRFTGRTPEERLDMRPWECAIHYRMVRHARGHVELTQFARFVE